MIRLVVLTALLLLLPTLAMATVRPPEEWFDSQDKLDQWKEFYPVLNEWEFGERELLTGPVFESVSGIKRFMGMDVAEVNRQISAHDETAALKYDLNLDGRIDHFDLLECGYQTTPKVKETSTAPSSGTNAWCVLRIDFSDYEADYDTYTVGYFNDRLFTTGGGANNKPSVHDYFNETSYGALSITGTVDGNGPNGDGWYEGELTQQNYHSRGGDWLVKEAVLAADPYVDFSQFDIDNDGFVDSLCVYYPGPVWWYGGLHPHRDNGLNLSVDGVIVDSYFLSVCDKDEDSYVMIISAHEYGHILGLPDLYDVDGGSKGVGNWSLMGSNYDDDQKPPSLDPWSKMILGWVTPVVVTDDLLGHSLGCYQDNPSVLKVWTDGIDYSQYFLIANYRQTGTDVNRPGEGLMIFHIDDHWYGTEIPTHINRDNANEFRKHVDVESARGYDDPNSPEGQDPLDHSIDTGHADDPWYSGNTAANYTGEFSTDTNPNSKAYDHDNGYPLIPTSVCVRNISAPGDTMTFDVLVESYNAPACVIDSPLTGTQSGEVTVQAGASAGTDRTISEVRFYCNSAYLGSDLEAPYELTFDSRAIYDGMREIKAVAIDNTGAIDTDTVTLMFENPGIPVPFEEGFEDGAIHSWISYDLFGSNTWEAKDQCNSGLFSAGISSESFLLDAGEHDRLVSPKFDLSGTTFPLILFYQRYNVYRGESTCKVFITNDDGETLDLLGSFTGMDLNWDPVSFNISEYAGDEVHIVFSLCESSLYASSDEAGWWLDDFAIREASGSPSILSITPGDNSMLTGYETITVNATDDIGITKVKFVIDSEHVIFTDHSAPFTLDWNSDWFFNGGHTFTAIAYDADAQTDTKSVNWTTTNLGYSLPVRWTFNTDQGSEWRIVNKTGSGEWHWKESEGFENTGCMRFCNVGGSTYGHHENDWYFSPTLRLDSLNNPGVGFVHKYSAGQQHDRGVIYVTTDFDTYVQLARFYNEKLTWQVDGADFQYISGNLVKLAFVFESDSEDTGEGWWIDSVLLDSIPLIYAVNPNRVSEGDTIRIIGSNFGYGFASDHPSVRLGIEELTVTGWGPNEITATIPMGAYSGSIRVSRHGIESDRYPIRIVLPATTITDVGEL